MTKPVKIIKHLSEKEVRSLCELLEERRWAAITSGPSEIERACRDRAMIDLMLFGGLRLSEVRLLSWCDVRADMSALKVLGKGKRERLVVVCKRLREALRVYRANTQWIEGGTGRVIRKVMGGVLSGHQLWRRSKRLLLESGVRREVCHPHALRHTFAMMLYEKGVDLGTISRLLGHGSLEVTMVYASASVKLEEAATRVLDRVMKRIEVASSEGSSNPGGQGT